MLLTADMFACYRMDLHQMQLSAHSQTTLHHLEVPFVQRWGQQTAGIALHLIGADISIIPSSGTPTWTFDTGSMEIRPGIWRHVFLPQNRF